MHKNDILLQKSGVDLRTVLNDRDFYVLNRRNRVWNCSALVKVFDLLFQVFPLGRLFLWLLHCICDKLAITTSHLFDTTAISLLQNASYIACRRPFLKIGNLNVKAQGIVNNKQTLTTSNQEANLQHYGCTVPNVAFTKSHYLVHCVFSVYITNYG